jgi:xanthine dehydrogenase small subunit
MRDHVFFYLNGRRHQVRGEAVFSSLTDFLRGDRHLTGTKVVCAEGDCGACTVLIGQPASDTLRYHTVDACIYFLYQLDGQHVVTVEGLADNGRLTAVQEAMVGQHGSQCGYCTPGIVLALTALFEHQHRPGIDDLRLGLTGNLCRCTGYLQILEACLSVDPAALVPLAQRYPTQAIANDLREQTQDPMLIPHGRRTVFAARSLEEALAFKARHPEAVIVSGNTELGVLRNKKNQDPLVLLSLTGVPGLAAIAPEDGAIAVGANVTWTQLERFARDAWPEFYAIILRFGSPQIRNVATLAGNVANGSPIADSLPFLFVTGAEVELAGRRGRRRVAIDSFYRGYKRTELAPDEILTRVIIPQPGRDELLRLYKVSKRNDLDIATFGAGVRVKRAGDHIERAWIAYSGVAPTVVSLPRTEAFLEGRPFAEETFAEAGRLARSEIQPISDVRGSRDFRWQLAENILHKFWFDCAAASV